MKIDIDNNAGIITVEGIKITVELIVQLLNHPQTDCLFSFRREGDQMHVETYYDVDSTKKFFAPKAL